ncbi:MAG: penicillin-binding protein 2 [Acidimicrobiales bacterium]
MVDGGTRLRLGIIGIVVVSLLATLLARLWYLQVLTAPSYKQAAERNRVRTVALPAPRGRILDRDGEVLVENRVSNVVAVDRSQLEDDEDRDRLLERLSALLDQPVADLGSRLDNPRVGPFSPTPVAVDVPEETMAYIKEHQRQLPAVTADRLAVRNYPHGILAAHTLGYVGEVSEEELESRKGRYEPGDQIGKAGIERMYDADLRGRDGEVRLEIDAAGVLIGVLDRRPPVPGDDVVLSIDLEVQQAAEQALAGGLEAARGRRFVDNRERLVADGGAVVVLDAKEGTVRAMASFPTFDPARPDLSFADPAAPVANRAVQGQYAPGSTWKLVTATAALERRLISARTTVEDEGTFRIPDCSGKCVFRNAGSARYGRVDVTRALAVSSDVFFYTQGNSLWVQRDRFGETAIQDTAVRLGFGTETGATVPAEADGVIPTPELRERRHEENPEAFPNGRWFAGDNLNLAIGQGELAVTPIQLANAYATFANGGTRFEPNLVLRVQRADGTVVRQVDPRVAERIRIDPQVRVPVMAGLVGATADPEGTAYRAFAGFPLDRYPVAGKTGTAQARPQQDTALFAAIAPADDPRFSVSVVMEQAGFGTTSAAPVARRVLGALSGLEGPTLVELVSGGRG